MGGRALDEVTTILIWGGFEQRRGLWYCDRKCCHHNHSRLSEAQCSFMPDVVHSWLLEWGELLIIVGTRKVCTLRSKGYL